ncbi:MAG: hypothetical protein U5P41_14590 [Gammaproteobacteria bacterium]|nr:hypothetical protein [Gammaproteobacteria bacterium]
MGDVLTGVLAGLLAQREALGLDLAQVAELGVCLHAAAADEAAAGGERGLLATRTCTPSCAGWSIPVSSVGSHDSMDVTLSDSRGRRYGWGRRMAKAAGRAPR